MGARAALYVPAAQRAHEGAPTSAELFVQRERFCGAWEGKTLLPAYRPGSQSLHDDAPIPLDVPASQNTHVDALVAPTAGLNLPAAQDSHAGAPAKTEKLPGAQGLHADALAAPFVTEKVPAGQALQAVLPVALQLPIAQHAPAPALLYVRAAQGAQAGAPAAA
jgi:hypothetical protein